MGHAWAGHGYALREEKWGESIDNPESNGGKDDKTQDFGVPCFQTNAHDAGTCATHNLHCQVSTVGFNEGIRKVLAGPHATQTP